MWDGCRWKAKKHVIFPLSSLKCASQRHDVTWRMFQLRGSLVKKEYGWQWLMRFLEKQIRMSIQNGRIDSKNSGGSVVFNWAVFFVCSHQPDKGALLGNFGIWRDSRFRDSRTPYQPLPKLVSAVHQSLCCRSKERLFQIQLGPWKKWEKTVWQTGSVSNWGWAKIWQI